MSPSLLKPLPAEELKFRMAFAAGTLRAAGPPSTVIAVAYRRSWGSTGNKLGLMRGEAARPPSLMARELPLTLDLAQASHATRDKVAGSFGRSLTGQRLQLIFAMLIDVGIRSSAFHRSSETAKRPLLCCLIPDGKPLTLLLELL